MADYDNYTASQDDKEPGKWMVTKNGDRYVGGIVSQTEAFKILEAIWGSERKTE